MPLVHCFRSTASPNMTSVLEDLEPIYHSPKSSTLTSHPQNATVLATEDKLLIAPAITTKPMTFADVMIWVFGAILLTLLVSLFLVYIVQRK